jgi:hypothetical protein
MKIHNIGTSESSKYRILIPKPIIEKVLHWDNDTELDYDVKQVDGKLLLIVFKKELSIFKEEK